MKMKPFTEGRTLSGGDRTFYNGKYQCILTPGKSGAATLAIRREDRKAIMDWRDVQWVKNQLLGPEIEACQIFPAESRLVDTSNQYYIYSLPPGERFPMGFKERGVVESVRLTTDGVSFSEQRPFADHVRPPDLEGETRRFTKSLLEHGAKFREDK